MGSVGMRVRSILRRRMVRLPRALRLRRIRRVYSRSSRPRRVLLALGAATFVAGLALLSIGLYDLTSGGDSRAGPAVIDLGEPVEAIFDQRPRAPTPSPKPVGALSRVSPLGDQPYRMVIEKLSVDAPVSAYGLDENAVPIVPTGDDAKEVVAWYDFSSKPGAGSNAVFAGHVTWYGQAVFYNLVSLATGDLVKLRAQDGTELVYQVTSTFSVDPNDPDSLKVMQPTADDVITIITCDGVFTDTDDPVFGGDYSSRLVVRAALTTVNVSGPGQSGRGAGGG